MITSVSLGSVYMSASVSMVLESFPTLSDFVYSSLSRHRVSDWGDCCVDDAYFNDTALKEGSRLFSVYHLPSEFTSDIGQESIWIITEADRSATTILFPSDY
jgi:hypothetical protein